MDPRFRKEYDKVNPVDVATQYVTVSSYNRDRSKYPTPSHYRVDLMAECGVQYKDIISVSLYSGVISAGNSVTDSPLFLLYIDELSSTSTFTGNDQYLQGAFCMLQMDRPVQTSFFNIRPDLTRVISGTTVRRLDTLTITITDARGTQVNFGSDTSPPTAPTLSLQNWLTFEIKYNKFSL